MLLILGALGEQEGATSAPATQEATSQASVPWEVIRDKEFSIAVPKGWRRLPEIIGPHVLYLNGDGIGAPLIDETGAPIQIGITVERYGKVKTPPKEGAKQNLSTLKFNPGLKVLSQDKIVPVTLADGTAAVRIRVLLQKDRTRKSLQQKLFAADSTSRSWVVSAWIVTGRNSQFIEKNQWLEELLRVHMTTLCFDAEKFSAAGLEAAYRLSRTRPATSSRLAVGEWELPAKRLDMVGELSGSADGSVICLTVMSFLPRGGAVGRPDFKLWMLQTTTGKLTDLGQLLSKQIEQKDVLGQNAIPSADGKHLLVLTGMAGRPPKMAAHLLTVEGQAVHKLAEGMLMIVGAWSKDGIYLGLAGADGKIGPVQVHDPAGGEARQLKVCGMMMMAEAAGKFLVCACDEDEPTKPLSLGGMDRAVMMVVSPDGKVLAKLSASQEVSSLPVLSPNGKYLAFGRETPGGREGPPKPLGARIVSAEGKVHRDVGGDVTPLAVTDKGELIASVRDGHGPTTIKRIDLAGKAETIVAKSRAAVVCGDRLFYVSAENEKTQKLIAVKLWPESTTTQPAQSADLTEAQSELKLAKVYLATGMKDKGVAILRAVLQKYPGTEAAEAAKLELDRLESGD